MGYVQVFQEKDHNDIVSFGATVVRDCGHSETFRASGLSREEAWYDGYVSLSDQCPECLSSVGGMLSCDRCGCMCEVVTGLGSQHRILEVL